jgi:hypothetical protein
VPSGFPEGIWAFAQLVIESAAWEYFNGNLWKLDPVDDDYLLDTSFPYGKDPDNPGTYPTGDEIHENNDTPQTPIAPLLQLKRDMTFLMYIVFKPGGADSRFVPLYCARWGAHFCATKTSDSPVTWDLFEPDVWSWTWEETSDHPTWLGNARPSRQIRIDFLAPCGD